MPRLVEIDSVDLAIPPSRAWEVVRHGNLADSPIARALFAIRTIPDRLHGEKGPATLSLDELVSTPEKPGFSILVDDAPNEVAVGAIGKVWHMDIPFVHVASPDAYAAFSEPDFVKVAWSLAVEPRGEDGSRVTLELRVDATDPEAWNKFRAYFLLIGPGSRFIRRSLMASLEREHGTPESREDLRPMSSDAFLPDAAAQLTQGITIEARPDAIWPWLVQMGCRRAGFYSIDALDNANVPSAREVHPELQDLHVGDVLPATPNGNDGFEVLRIAKNRELVLGGLFDPIANRQLRFDAQRPERYWHVTWAFELEALDARTTRLHVRVRGAFPKSGRLHAAWIRPVHLLMQTAQLRHLKARAEGKLARDSLRDVARGASGAAAMVAAFLTPFFRGARSHWGLDEATASRTYPGDDLVPSPRWSWTHGIEIDARAEDVWPWVAQIGADRGGFYSYQWLENVAGCNLRNAEAIHPEWAMKAGDDLRLHPKMPPLKIVAMEPGRWLVAHGPADEEARAAGRPWVEVTWLFFVEPLGDARCRFVSRYRCATSDETSTRLQFGPTFVEPIGFAMDRRMLLGVKERAEAARRRA